MKTKHRRLRTSCSIEPLTLNTWSIARLELFDKRFYPTRFSRSSMCVATEWIIVPLSYDSFVAEATKIESENPNRRFSCAVLLNPSYRFACRLGCDMMIFAGNLRGVQILSCPVRLFSQGMFARFFGLEYRSTRADITI